jgi:hypothetical protein
MKAEGTDSYITSIFMNTFIWEWEHEMSVNDDKYGMVIHNLLVESAGTKNDENINLMTKMEILKMWKRKAKEKI